MAEGSVRPICFLIPLMFGVHALQWYRCSMVGMFSLRCPGKGYPLSLQSLSVGLGQRMRLIGIANCKTRKIQGFAGLLIYICSTPFAYDEHKAGFSLHCQLSHWIFPYPFPLSPSSWLVFTRPSTGPLSLDDMDSPFFTCNIYWKVEAKNPSFSIFSAFPLI